MKDLEHRMIPSEDDRLEITQSPSGDSILVRFICDYQDHIDSALQLFQMPFNGSENFHTLQIDSIHSLVVSLGGNGDYARLSITRRCTEPFGYYNSQVYTNYYQFGGFKTQ